MVASGVALLVAVMLLAVIVDRGLPNALICAAIWLVRTSQAVARWLVGVAQRMESRRAVLAAAQQREAAEVIR
jgi:hypothetical protein